MKETNTLVYGGFLDTSKDSELILIHIYIQRHLTDQRLDLMRVVEGTVRKDLLPFHPSTKIIVTLDSRIQGDLR